MLKVREILEYDTVTRVPRTPGFVRGVINLRGRVVPVVDLAVRFGLPPSPVTNRSCVVIVEVELDGEAVVMGLVADAVSQVVELLAGEIEPPPAFGTRADVGLPERPGPGRSPASSCCSTSTACSAKARRRRWRPSGRREARGASRKRFDGVGSRRRRRRGPALPVHGSNGRRERKSPSRTTAS